MKPVSPGCEAILTQADKVMLEGRNMLIIDLDITVCIALETHGHHWVPKRSVSGHRTNDGAIQTIATHVDSITIHGHVQNQAWHSQRYQQCHRSCYQFHHISLHGSRVDGYVYHYNRYHLLYNRLALWLQNADVSAILLKLSPSWSR